MCVSSSEGPFTQGPLRCPAVPLSRTPDVPDSFRSVSVTLSGDRGPLRPHRGVYDRSTLIRRPGGGRGHGESQELVTRESFQDPEIPSFVKGLSGGCQTVEGSGDRPGPFSRRLKESGTFSFERVSVPTDTDVSIVRRHET